MNRFHPLRLAAQIIMFAAMCHAMPAAATEMMPPMGPPPMHQMPFEMPGHLPPFLRGIDLSEAQQDRLFELFNQNAPAVRNKMKQVQKSERALHEAALAEHYDESKIKELAAVQAHAIADMSILMASLDHAAFEILTAEQRKQALAHHERHEGGFPPPSDMPLTH